MNFIFFYRLKLLAAAQQVVEVLRHLFVDDFVMSNYFFSLPLEAVLIVGQPRIALSLVVMLVLLVFDIDFKRINSFVMSWKKKLDGGEVIFLPGYK